jgi:hypothetical protein
MGDQFAELSYTDLILDVTVWGVATAQGTVRACRSRQDAKIDAGIAAPIPIRGARGQVTSVYPLVYYHPDQGWTYAAIGQPVTPTTADTEPGGAPPI